MDWSGIWGGLTPFSRGYLEQDPRSAWAMYLRTLGGGLDTGQNRWLANSGYGRAYADYTAEQVRDPTGAGLWGEYIARNANRYQNEYNLLPASQRGDSPLWGGPPRVSGW